MYFFAIICLAICYMYPTLISVLPSVGVTSLSFQQLHFAKTTLSITYTSKEVPVIFCFAAVRTSGCD